MSETTLIKENQQSSNGLINSSLSPDLETNKLENNQSNSAYETDFYAWTQSQAKLLSQQRWDELDVVNLIEEIESLGKQQRQELRNRLSILIGHLLKWEYQPERRTRSWLSTIRIQRRDTLKLLKDNPSLQSNLAEIVAEAYLNGKDLAIGETDLPDATFPLECGYNLTDILSDRFYPGIPSELVELLEK